MRGITRKREVQGAIKGIAGGFTLFLLFILLFQLTTGSGGYTEDIVFYASLVTGPGWMLLSHFIAEGYIAPLFNCQIDVCFEATEKVTFWIMVTLLLTIYGTIGATLQARSKKN